MSEEERQRQEEERQRQMDFIVSWQAKFAADLQMFREQQQEEWKQQQERWRQADEKWAETANGISALLAIAEIHEREIMENGRQIDALREAGRETDERLSVLVNTVERIISEGRNGGPLKG
jgi:hypothetical protein